MSSRFAEVNESGIMMRPPPSLRPCAATTPSISFFPATGPPLAASPDGSARAVGAGRGCGDGASAGWVIVGATFEAPTVVSSLDDVAVMGQPIEQSGRHL